MKKIQQLTVFHSDKQQLVLLLDKMKQTKNKKYKYLSSESINYAKNIFSEPSMVACFKTDRKTLFECRIWLYIGNKGLVLANITSDLKRRLEIGEYNMILNSFFKEIIQPFIEDFKYEITSEDFSLDDILPESVYSKLNLWQSYCNKSNPIGHPLDNGRWLDFVISYYYNPLAELK